jgi:hypothetical protein
LCLVLCTILSDWNFRISSVLGLLGNSYTWLLSSFCVVYFSSTTVFCFTEQTFALVFFLQNKISHFFFANNGFARVVNCKCKHAAVLVSSAVTVLHLLIFVFCLYFSF